MACRRSCRLIVLALLLAAAPAHAVELTGRLSLLGAAAQARPGDLGYTPGGDNRQLLDQESLRLMLDDTGKQDEWSLHAKAVRQNAVRYPLTSLGPSDLFRSDRLSGDWQNDQTASHTTRIRYEIDRAFYKLRAQSITLSVGRQPIDWGSGRFWQPLNVFGAFAPTDLDTDYKPGIDAAVLAWFPSAFSALTAVYVPVLNRQLTTRASGVVHYRRQVGEASELQLLAGSVLGDRVAGASFETDIGGMGWRLEGRYTTANHGSVFWITGIDYQFGDSTTLTLEWYENSAGAASEADLARVVNERAVRYGLQQQLGRHVLGVSLNRTITPLLTGNYLLLASGLKNAAGGVSASLLHQLSLTYSLSNESDLLFALLVTTGKGESAAGVPQSEFGHAPASAMLRYRLYF
ncbi:MAG TPA: hypothetical protein VNH42_05420 [Mariprofundaceae bacterium]|nr:hypothetical protein [Mariprofundaceae bacterium]